MKHGLPLHRRGLTLIELLIALIITAMVGAAIAAMLGVVSSGVTTRRDTRSILIQGSAAQSRLGAYIMPSRCVLSSSDGNLVLWFKDSRESGTVHATEIRWLIYDEELGTISVYFVSFPEEWSQLNMDLEDHEYSSTTDWMNVLDDYGTNGWIAGFALADGLESVSISLDHNQAQQARQVTYRLGFASDAGEVVTIATGAIKDHKPPSS